MSADSSCDILNVTNYFVFHFGRVEICDNSKEVFRHVNIAQDIDVISTSSARRALGHQPEILVGACTPL
jgi:hypothetical protein